MFKLAGCVRGRTFPVIAGLFWLGGVVSTATAWGQDTPSEQEKPAAQTSSAPVGEAGQNQDHELKRFEQSQVHMGTLCRIALYAPSEMAATTCFQKAFERIAKLDQIMSDYRDDSEISQLSRSSGGPPAPVGPELLDILDRSTEYSYLSNGAFDVTIGPAVRQWRRARRLHKMPTKEQIQSSLACVGQDKLRVDRGDKTVELMAKGMLLDLGGIAKGYACDEVVELLQQMGVTSVLVDIGGNVVVSGDPPGKEGWQVEIAPPKGEAIPADKADLLKIELSEQAIATSGDAEQFVEFDGVRYSHIVDPKTGLGLTRRVQVTVLAPDGTTADALSTALSVMSFEEGKELVAKLDGVAALYLVKDGESLRIMTAGEWPKSRMSASSKDSSLLEQLR